MKHSRRAFLLGGAAVAAMPGVARTETSSRLMLWYRSPAVRWLQALPVGNGQMGAMVFGDPAVERVHLSDSTLWSGAPSGNNINPGAKESLPRVRELIFNERYDEADALCRSALLGHAGQFGTALPLGCLSIESQLPGAVSGYRRSLDLDEAVARVKFQSGSIHYEREVFASHPAKALVVRLTADRRDSITCRVRFSGPQLPGSIEAEGADTLLFRGHAWETLHSDGTRGVAFACRTRVVTEGGAVHADGGSLTITDASAVTVITIISTDFPGAKDEDNPETKCLRALNAAASLPYDTLRQAHIADHRRLFRRVSLDLGEDALLSHLSTDERRKQLSANEHDPGLCALFFQYGRYLTIAGSREDSPLPLALQGIWNDGLAASMGWTDDFHMDINTQQNYWVCESGNLAECHAPLWKLIASMQESGQHTAREMYGAPGWVSHVFTNAWGFTAPGWGLGWGLFPTGGVWIALQLWDSFRFSGDRSFLHATAYPVLRDAAVFFLSYMVRHPRNGWLVAGPSNSPENWFIAPGSGKHCTNSMGTTADRVLIYALFSACIEASQLLQTDEALRRQLVEARGQLSPLQVGRHGQLQEWLEDFEEAEPNHRHTSHLIALYPEDQISPVKTPALADAARVTLKRRMEQPNWEDTEWSRANLVNYYARLLDAESAHRQYLGLIQHAADDSLLTYSRGGVAGAENNIFAIDGNCAGAAGLAEMLLQSHASEIHLLPALPHAWPRGEVRGLKARGGIEISMRWTAGTLVSATLRSAGDATCTLRYRDANATIKLAAGRMVRVSRSLFHPTRGGMARLANEGASDPFQNT